MQNEEHKARRASLVAEREQAIKDFEAQVKVMRAELEATFDAKFDAFFKECGYR